MLLRLVAAPAGVYIKQQVNVAAPNGPMQRADHGDFQSRQFLQCSLYLRPVFSYDVAVIPSGFRQPVLRIVQFVNKNIAIQGSEAAKGVGGEQDIFAFLIGHHNFRPMDHGRQVKMQGMAAERERILFFNGNCPALQIHIVELPDEGKGFGIPDDFQPGKTKEKFTDVGAVIRLHMVYH